MKIEISIITPAIANEILKLNTNNRKLNPQRVAVLASAIQRGEWQVTHQGIALAPDGRLLDGQHRLAAIVAAGESVKMPVWYDCDPETFSVIDVGKARSAADALRINPQKAAIARLALYLLEADTFGIKHSNQYTSAQISVALDWLAPKHDGLLRFCSHQKKGRSNVGVQLAVICRMAKHPEHYTQIGEQYHHFVFFDIQKFSPGVALLVKQLDRKVVTGNQQIEMLSRAWDAFEPGNDGIKKIYVGTSDVKLQDIKKVLQKMSGVIPPLDLKKKTKILQPLKTKELHA